MGEILKAGGVSYSSVVKTTIMYIFLLYLLLYLVIFFIMLTKCFFSHRLADLKDFKKVNEIYAKCKSGIEKFILHAIVFPVLNSNVLLTSEGSYTS